MKQRAFVKVATNSEKASRFHYQYHGEHASKIEDNKRIKNNSLTQKLGLPKRIASVHPRLRAAVRVFYSTDLSLAHLE